MSLQDILNGLCLDPVSAHFELRVDPTEEVHALRSNVDLASVAGAVKAAELGVGDKFPCSLLRQVTITAREMNATDTKFSDFAVEQWTELFHAENDVCYVGERRADGDRFSWPQILAIVSVLASVGP